MLRPQGCFLKLTVGGLAALAFGHGAESSILKESSAEMGQVRVYESVDIVTGQYGDDFDQFGLRQCRDGTLIGISTFCVAENGAVFVADCVKRRITPYSPDGIAGSDISYPQGWEVLRLAASGGGLYALGVRHGRDTISSAERTNVQSQDERHNAAPREYKGRTPDRPHPYEISCRSSEGGRSRSLGLLVWRGELGEWEPCTRDISNVHPVERTKAGKSVPERIALQTHKGEVYLYDPAAGRTWKLTDGGETLTAGLVGFPYLQGRLLSSGVRVIRNDEGLCLLKADEDTLFLPWLKGHILDSDSLGRLFVCEVGDGERKPRVTISVFGTDGSPVAGCVLPGRNGRVRMVGPRIVVSPDGALYEFWSSLDEFHIVRWEASQEARVEGWAKDI